MATNITKDPMQYMLQQLKNAEIHLSAAQDRLKNAKEKQKKKKAELGPKYKRPDLPDTNSVIRNLETKIANLKYCIHCMEVVQEMEESEDVLYVSGTNKDVFGIRDVYKEVDKESELPITEIETLTIDDPVPTILHPEIHIYVAKDTENVFVFEKTNDNHFRLRNIGQVYHQRGPIKDRSNYEYYDSAFQLINALYEYTDKKLYLPVKLELNIGNIGCVDDNEEVLKISTTYPKSER